MAAQPTVFVSYSHRDREWQERLRVHLAQLVRQGSLRLWDDSHIDVGGKWRQEISKAIDEAQAAIMLLSADFLASEFIASHELPRLLHKANSDGTEIILLIVQPCSIRQHPELAEFKCINDPARPLSGMTHAEAEHVFVEIADRLQKFGPAPDGITNRPSAHANHASAAKFDEVRANLVCFKLLEYFAELSESDRGSTFSEAVKALDLSPRRIAYAAKTSMEKAEWLWQSKQEGKAMIQITGEGKRQLRRLRGDCEEPTT